MKLRGHRVNTLRELYRGDVLRARGDNKYLLVLLKEALVVLQGDKIRDDEDATKLADEIEDLVRPLEPKVHIAWSEHAICHFTVVPPSEWPAEVGSVDLGGLVRPLREPDGKLVMAAYPPKDWAGVTCDACRVRLPVIVQEIGEIDFASAMRAGVHAAIGTPEQSENEEKTP